MQAAPLPDATRDFTRARVDVFRIVVHERQALKLVQLPMAMGPKLELVRQRVSGGRSEVVQLRHVILDFMQATAPAPVMALKYQLNPRDNQQ